MAHIAHAHAALFALPALRLAPVRLSKPLLRVANSTMVSQAQAAAAAAKAAAAGLATASGGALHSLETLGGVLPDTLPRGLRLFIVCLLLAHALALALWAASFAREAGGKKLKPAGASFHAE